MTDQRFADRETAEIAAEEAERSHRRYTQRISDLEYGIDAALSVMEDLDDDTDLKEVINKVRHHLATYRNPD